MLLFGILALALLIVLYFFYVCVLIGELCVIPILFNSPVLSQHTFDICGINFIITIFSSGQRSIVDGYFEIIIKISNSLF